MARTRILPSLAALCGVLVWTSALQAAPAAQSFEPPPGEVEGFATPEAEPLPHGVFSLGLSSSYARRPLVRRIDCALDTTDDPACVLARGQTPVVRDLIQVEALLAVGLFDALEAGLALPFAWQMQADDLAQPTRLQGAAGLGDARLQLKLGLLRGPLALALALTGSAPSGDADHGRGASGPTLVPQLIGRVQSGALALSLALGARVRERQRLAAVEQGSELDALLGLVVGMSESVDLRAELHGRAGLVDGGEDRYALETTLGAGFTFDALELLAGIGGALPPGYVGNGTPALRAVLAARYAIGRSAPGRGATQATAASEGDGDRDGLAGAADLCALLPEDADQFDDGDGCPDLDDDADGLRDDADRCPRKSEDRDGFEDDDGCPEADNDGDTIADAVDACGMDPEDVDRFQDEDGCPEPGPNPLRVALENGRITVSEPILFEHDSSELRQSTLPMLDRVASLIATLPSRQMIRVEGHTDPSGNAAYDRVISTRRARAVVTYLVKQGIAEGRLSARGHGASRPVVKGVTPEARARNRRVELSVE